VKAFEPLPVLRQSIPVLMKELCSQLACFFLSVPGTVFLCAVTLGAAQGRHNPERRVQSSVPPGCGHHASYPSIYKYSPAQQNCWVCERIFDGFLDSKKRSRRLNICWCYGIYQAFGERFVLLVSLRLLLLPGPDCLSSWPCSIGDRRWMGYLLPCEYSQLQGRPSWSCGQHAALGTRRWMKVLCSLLPCEYSQLQGRLSWSCGHHAALGSRRWMKVLCSLLPCEYS
jgi:hypothetical protein